MSGSQKKIRFRTPEERSLGRQLKLWLTKPRIWLVFNAEENNEDKTEVRSEWDIRPLLCLHFFPIWQCLSLYFCHYLASWRFINQICPVIGWGYKRQNIRQEDVGMFFEMTSTENLVYPGKRGSKPESRKSECFCIPWWTSKTLCANLSEKLEGEIIWHLIL